MKRERAKPAEEFPPVDPHWAQAYQDCQRALREWRSRGRALRRSLKYIEKMIADREPFPGVARRG